MLNFIYLLYFFNLNNYTFSIIFVKLSVKEQTRKTKIFGAVSQLNTLLLGLEQKRHETTKYVSKIDELIDLGYNKLDTNTKDFMDAIKMLARNIFYLSFQSFKEKYNNYRDDHDFLGI